jgi:hypothetical protein
LVEEGLVEEGLVEEGLVEETEDSAAGLVARLQAGMAAGLVAAGSVAAMARTARRRRRSTEFPDVAEVGQLLQTMDSTGLE